MVPLWCHYGDTLVPPWYCSRYGIVFAVVNVVSLYVTAVIAVVLWCILVTVVIAVPLWCSCCHFGAAVVVL